MPTPNRAPAQLQTEIRIVCDMMLKVHYFEESNWLWTAARYPNLCASDRAQKALQSAAPIAREFGFPYVSEWLNELLARLSSDSGLAADAARPKNTGGGAGS